MFDDDLTEADLEFLNRFNKLGRSETADSEYNPDDIPEPDHDADSDPDAEGAEFGDTNVETSDDGDGTSDAETDLPDGEGNESGESDSIDESKMDISEVETEPQEPKSGKDSSDEAEEKDHLEGGDTDSEIPEGEDDLPFEHDTDHDDQSDSEIDSDDDFDEREEDAQTEEDDGEGERANSDEARESDEPIKSGDDDSDDEADELSEDHDEPEDEVNEENVRDKMDEADPDFAKDDQDAPEQELDAEGESDFEGDAQQELEDHLKENDPESDSETEDNSEQDEDTSDDAETESEPEEKPEQQQQGGSGEGNSNFSDLPAAGDTCSDHCEDNEAEDGEHECPRCAERIMRERKQWGVIATDMHGKDVLPGDKLRVEIPMSFFVQGQILTANVPNAEMERFAVKTNDVIDKGALWLSGRNISQFTGYHMIGTEIPIWTFSQGRKLRFAEKIGEPEREGGGQGDIEDMIDQLNQDLEEGKFDQGKDESQDNLDTPEDESENDEDSDGGPRGSLTSTQMHRFENLFERIAKKAAQTFGSTAEVVEEGEISVTEEGRVARPIKIKSRGVEYTLVLVAERGQE